ncbi:MAG: glycoside hydrolase family 43 protein [Opitutales bacterium]|nr:glycoside hydrolase family 43 protein [Opitutales bacterium]
MASETIRNPILPGFHPDPCVLRVGGVYYIATSTFEWWPGVRIHASTDLVHWRHCAYAVTRRSQVDMRGVPCSGGIWAPALSHDGERFHLVYSNVYHFARPHKDVENFLITAENIEGPWSDPVRLNGVGFDPSLFHDSDGRKYLLQQLWDPRPGKNHFAGITLQEYDPEARGLVGERKLIFHGTQLGCTEGPHLYRINGWYYLVTAEGGTSWNHAVTVARSHAPVGPYEVCPHNPVLTAHGFPDSPLRKTGHGSLVQTDDGAWWMAHLCARPLEGNFCVLGRETALQPVEWTDDGWPRIPAQGPVPSLRWSVHGRPAPDTADTSPANPAWAGFSDQLAKGPLGPEWNTQREPADDSWLGWARGRGLVLRGRQSLSCRYRQSLVACRLRHFRARVAVQMEFDPQNFMHSAGLAFFYNTEGYLYLRLSRGDDGTARWQIIQCRQTEVTYLLESEIDAASSPVWIQGGMRDGRAQFHQSADGIEWSPVGGGIDARFLSDEGALVYGFTGCYIALAAEDLSGGGRPAVFRDFTYTPDPA